MIAKPSRKRVASVREYIASKPKASRASLDAVRRAILEALPNTLILTVSASGIGLLLGLVLAVAGIARARWLRWPARVYTDVFRGLPEVVIILVIGLGVGPMYADTLESALTIAVTSDTGQIFDLDAVRLSARPGAAFPKGIWIRHSEMKKRLEGGGFGRPKPPLFPGDGGRHRQRAFRDALADILPLSHAWLPTLRTGWSRPRGSRGHPSPQLWKAMAQLSMMRWLRSRPPKPSRSINTTCSDGTLPSAFRNRIGASWIFGWRGNCSLKAPSPFTCEPFCNSAARGFRAATAIPRTICVARFSAPLFLAPRPHRRDRFR